MAENLTIERVLREADFSKPRHWFRAARSLIENETASMMSKVKNKIIPKAKIESLANQMHDFFLYNKLNIKALKNEVGNQYKTPEKMEELSPSIDIYSHIESNKGIEKPQRLLLQEVFDLNYHGFENISQDLEQSICPFEEDFIKTNLKGFSTSKEASKMYTNNLEMLMLPYDTYFAGTQFPTADDYIEMMHEPVLNIVNGIVKFKCNADVNNVLQQINLSFIPTELLSEDVKNTVFNFSSQLLQETIQNCDISTRKQLLIDIFSPEGDKSKVAKFLSIELQKPHQIIVDKLNSTTNSKDVENFKSSIYTNTWSNLQAYQSDNIQFEELIEVSISNTIRLEQHKEKVQEKLIELISIRLQGMSISEQEKESIKNMYRIASKEWEGYFTSLLLPRSEKNINIYKKSTDKEVIDSLDLILRRIEPEFNSIPPEEFVSILEQTNFRVLANLHEELTSSMFKDDLDKLALIKS